MRAIVTTRNGDVDAMEVKTRPDPAPGKGEVLIRVKSGGAELCRHPRAPGFVPRWSAKALCDGL
jgi:hypothetical protein